MTLAEFQRDFAQTLQSAPEANTHPALAVYRNTVMKGCLDALEANFPAVTKLVGREWFRSAAAVHVSERPPRDARLVDYGEHFSTFLAAFEPAAELPYLPAIADLDRAWIESHVAADADALGAQALATLAPEVLGTTVLVPHPATRWQWHAQWPIHAIWSRNRTDNDESHAEIEWRGEGVLLTRPLEHVQWVPIGAAAAAFLSSCAQGQPLAEAAQLALEAEPDCDLATTLALLLTQGAFLTSSITESLR